MYNVYFVSRDGFEFHFGIKSLESPHFYLGPTANLLIYHSLTTYWLPFSLSLTLLFYLSLPLFLSFPTFYRATISSEFTNFSSVCEGVF